MSCFRCTGFGEEYVKLRDEDIIIDITNYIAFIVSLVQPQKYILLVIGGDLLFVI